MPVVLVLMAPLGLAYAIPKARRRTSVAVVAVGHGTTCSRGNRHSGLGPHTQLKNGRDRRNGPLAVQSVQELGHELSEQEILSNTQESSREELDRKLKSVSYEALRFYFDVEGGYLLDDEVIGHKFFPTYTDEDAWAARWSVTKSSRR